jgi:hypothetical protein
MLFYDALINSSPFYKSLHKQSEQYSSYRCGLLLNGIKSPSLSLQSLHLIFSWQT